MQQNHDWDEYRRMWNELHNRALDHKDGVNDSVWLLTWAKRLKPFQKKGTCSCNEHYNKWKKNNPPNFATREKYFEWTVRLHNSVNRLGNKKEWTVEESKKFYEEQRNKDKNIAGPVQPAAAPVVPPAPTNPVIKAEIKKDTPAVQEKKPSNK
jgi:hypothetical protein